MSPQPLKKGIKPCHVAKKCPVHAHVVPSDVPRVPIDAIIPLTPCGAASASNVACFHPLKAWRSHYVNPANGKRGITFSISKAYTDLPISIPCGQCIGCRLHKSRMWAVRCAHEMQMHEDNCFITLTYNAEHLPAPETLLLRDFQLFMKTLRNKNGAGIRFFHCGEYGDKLARPHYHALLFGHDHNSGVPSFFCPG